ncbi:hypothetical protein [Dyella sp.]|uniref:hypothetical protein n=1 Tax=Dyella sp. TaxID=1869338 RepID=UPI002ED240D0
MKVPALKMLRVTVVLIAALLNLVGCTTPRQYVWSPPPEGVIRDKVAATAIAHAIWFSMNPWKDEPSEQMWQEHFDAIRKGNTWYVNEKSQPPNSLGGEVTIMLDARDGRVIEVAASQ